MGADFSIVHVEAIATSTESVVLITIASEYASVRVEQGQAGAVFAACEDAVLGRSPAIEGLRGSERWVAEHDGGSD